MTETTRSFPRTFESDVKWSSAILVRLFVLWAVCSSFDFVTGQDDTVSLTTLDKPSSRVTSRILPSESSVNISSHSLEASGPFAKNGEKSLRILPCYRSFYRMIFLCVSLQLCTCNFSIKRAFKIPSQTGLNLQPC